MCANDNCKEINFLIIFGYDVCKESIVAKNLENSQIGEM